MLLQTRIFRFFDTIASISGSLASGIGDRPRKREIAKKAGSRSLARLVEGCLFILSDFAFSSFRVFAIA
jgi:hypothetical protein